MFTPEFDLFMAVLLGVLAVVFFMGKGRGILDAFSGKYKDKKRDPVEERKYQTAIGIFLVVLGVAELLMAFIRHPYMGIVSVAISVADLIYIMIYIRKH
ncbi:DUF3784 domain-containing protein [Bilifractor porci]|uniref:DUF3784 domain-containing protein n=1 Tax=Bilifractor porci TaxID=2606636 RepID=A0A7X2TNR5_9FIRM|nr:DUF3784 domain-containing protein [Bilifractor porci]MST81835.1 DUF3784 domain-containing protein [Bilifractor porci]